MTIIPSIPSTESTARMMAVHLPSEASTNLRTSMVAVFAPARMVLGLEMAGPMMALAVPVVAEPEGPYEDGATYARADCYTVHLSMMSGT